MFSSRKTWLTILMLVGWAISAGVLLSIVCTMGNTDFNALVAISLVAFAMTVNVFINAAVIAFFVTGFGDKNEIIDEYLSTHRRHK